MSYDITNYAFLGYPVKDFLEKISETDVPILEDKIYLVLDDKFEKAMECLPEDLRTRNDSNIDFIVKIGPSEIHNPPKQDGPTSKIVTAILSASGISNELLGDVDFRSELVESLHRELFVLPTDLIEYRYAGDELPGYGAVEIGENPLMQTLVKGLANLGRLTVLEGVTQDEDWNEVPNLSIHNFKSTLEGLVEKRASEDLVSVLLNQFIKPRETFVEELDEWTWDVGVVSTRYGDVHSLGGMESRELYLTISDFAPQVLGDFGGFAYDEDGWEDPRETNPEMVEKMKEILFGEGSDVEFQVYTPQFGG